MRYQLKKYREAAEAFRKAVKNNRSLCRRLGVGLLTVRLKDGLVEAHLDSVMQDMKVDENEMIPDDYLSL